jgi:hypothetical protein
MVIAFGIYFGHILVVNIWEFGDCGVLRIDARPKSHYQLISFS